jgi:hypothetical protein
MPNVVRRFLNFVRGSQGPREVKKGGRGKRALNLTPWMPTYVDWDIPDIDAALAVAETGNMQMIGRIADTLIGDGLIAGELSTRFDGMLHLPRYFEASVEEAPDGRPYRGSMRPAEEYAIALSREFDTLCPASELSLIARDGGLLNIMFGEILEDEDGRLRLVRRNPEFLTYRFSENQWYVRTAYGEQEPVTPGDGRWLLAFPHGSDYPWRYGLWRALAFAYVTRRQAFLNLGAWNNSLAFPIKKLTVPNGANEDEVRETFDAINHFGPFPAILLNEGWQFDLEHPSQTTPSSMKDQLEASKEDVIFAISGQRGTTEPGTGFANNSVFAKVKHDLIRGDAETMASALNEQVIPVWAQRRFSFDGWFHRPRVRWDATPPKDLASEANAVNVGGDAVKKWLDALVTSGAPERVDVAAMARKFGVPITGGVS